MVIAGPLVTTHASMIFAEHDGTYFSSDGEKFPCNEQPIMATVRVPLTSLEAARHWDVFFTTATSNYP
jgi:hypothetical protein